MNKVLRVACIQMCSGPDITRNLDDAAAMIREAAGQGAHFIAMPETTCFVTSGRESKFVTACDQETHPGLPQFSDLARTHDIWLLAGSFTIRLSEQALANRSFLFAPSGKIAATYDKIHMFDVQLPDGEVQKESAVMQPGDRACVTAMDPDWPPLGMSICYDVRFPHLYRDMARAGAGIISVPSAFTVSTGQAHWAVLLRARALETGAFIIAPAQGGDHQGARRTYGHSMIIDPWGDVLAEKHDDAPGILTADLDLKRIRQARQAIPQLTHDRSYSGP